MNECSNNCVYSNEAIRNTFDTVDWRCFVPACHRVDDAGCRFAGSEALQLVEGDGSIHEVVLVVLYRLSTLHSMLVGAELDHARHLVVCWADPAFSNFYRSLE